MVGGRASLGDAGLDLGHQLRLGAVAGEVGEGGTAVTRQGGGEALELVTSQLGRDVSEAERTYGARRYGGQALSVDDGGHGEKDSSVFIHGDD